MWTLWTYDCIKWWNEYWNVTEPWYHKRKALYIYGPANTGKTTFVECMLGKGNSGSIFYPGVGKFFMQDFDPQYHKVILFEEFDSKFYNSAQLKRLLEGKPFAYPVKGTIDKMITFRGPIIFVSNYDEMTDLPLRSRCLFVSAETPYFSVDCIAIPNTEPFLPEAEDQNNMSTM